jgi:hypothetical protein
MFTAEIEAVYMKRKADHDARYASSKRTCNAHGGSATNGWLALNQQTSHIFQFLGFLAVRNNSFEE